MKLNGFSGQTNNIISPICRRYLTIFFYSFPKISYSIAAVAVIRKNAKNHTNDICTVKPRESESKATAASKMLHELNVGHENKRKLIQKLYDRHFFAMKMTF